MPTIIHEPHFPQSSDGLRSLLQQEQIMRAWESGDSDPFSFLKDDVRVECGFTPKFDKRKKNTITV
jgi:hypothetical protein